MAISITVNGESKSAAEGQSIQDLLAALQVDPERVAVELNRRIVRRAHWNSTEVAPGAEIEIVQFVGGG